jgi:hypothetical protein
MTVKHRFVNPKADGGDATVARPSNWNDDHIIDDAGIIIGTSTTDIRLWRNGVGTLLIDSNNIAASSVKVQVQPNIASGTATVDLFNLTNTTYPSISLHTGTSTQPVVLLGSGTSAGDVALYRSAAGTLYISTDGSALTTNVQIVATAGQIGTFGMAISTDTQDRLVLRGDAGYTGVILGAGGAAAQDLYLRRSAAKTLIVDTDGSGGSLTTVDFKTTNFYVNGSPISASATQVSRDTAAAGDYVARIKASGDTQYRSILGIDAGSNAQLIMGPGGTTAPDTRHYRTGAGYTVIDANGSANSTTFALSGTTGGSYYAAQYFTQAGDIQQYRLGLWAGGGYEPTIAMTDGTATPDVRLRRMSAGILKFDTNASAVNTLVYAEATAAKAATLGVNIASDSNLRVAMDTADGLYFSSGAASRDIRLQRSSAGDLVIDAGGIAATSLVVDLKTGVASTGSTLNLYSLTNATQSMSFQTGTSGVPMWLMGPGTSALDVRIARWGTSTTRYDDNGVGNDVSVQYVATGATKQALVYATGGATGGAGFGVYLGTETYARSGINHNQLLAFSAGTTDYDVHFGRSGPAGVYLDGNQKAGTVTLDLKPNLAATGSVLNLFNLTNTTNPSISLQAGTSTTPHILLGPGNAAADVALSRSAAKTLQLDDTAGGSATLDLSLGQTRLPTASLISLTATEGYIGVNSNAFYHRLEYYDSQRQRSASSEGWSPYAFATGYTPNMVPTATMVTLAANGGSIAIPVQVVGHMYSPSVSFYIGASTSPTYELQIYVQALNLGNSGENTLRAISLGGRASAAGSASAINTAALSANCTMFAGLYWVVIRNTSASNTLIIGGTAVSTW